MNGTLNEQNSPSWLRPFFTVWTGQAFSLLGSQLVQFALVWWLTQTTGSATVLATATLAAFLPQIFLGPLAGALVDRWKRRDVMIAADSLIALATLGLALLFWAGVVQVWQVYLLVFLRAAASSFHFPAMQASTSLMVPEAHLSRIQGLNQGLQGAMNIGAAPLAALLIGVFPMQAVLAIDIFTAMLAITPLLFIPIPQPARSPQSGAAVSNTVLHDLRLGLRYVAAWPGLVILLSMATIINFMVAPASALQPLLVTRHFGGQAMQLAWLETAWGLGMVAGGLLLGAWGGFRQRSFTMLVGLLLMGGSLLAVGLTPANSLWLAVGFTFVIGFSGPIVNGPFFAILQAVVTPEMQGRVITLALSLASAMAPLGLLIAGPAADALGIQAWYIVGGVVTALLGAIAFFIPPLINIESKSSKNRAAPEEAASIPAAAKVA